MKATLQLNLGEALNADELRELTTAAEERHQSVERVLFEAARDLILRRRTSHGQAPTGHPAASAALPA